MKKYRVVFILLLFLVDIFHFVSAQEGNVAATDIFSPKKPPILPAGCESQGFAFDGKLLKLNTTGDLKQRIFLLENMTNDMVVLDRYDPKRAAQGAGAGFASQLLSKKWSALITDTADMAISCWARRAESVEYIACQAALLVCGFTLSDPLPAWAGTLWLTENQSLEAVLQAIEAKGIVLP